MSNLDSGYESLQREAAPRQLVKLCEHIRGRRRARRRDEVELRLARKLRAAEGRFAERRHGVSSFRTVFCIWVSVRVSGPTPTLSPYNLPSSVPSLLHQSTSTSIIYPIPTQKADNAPVTSPM
ncbi:hypothetical protein EVAR_94816_1 [Eumeta japonica]|uniref:Uncharacterized protein n=1 Tax=Eumeta variegata TaxID=151549 RepID=A0A4C1UI79_EUMVA|nr:hypothetical protein EVAR_94816_1 [Eumeta japonica]